MNKIIFDPKSHVYTKGEDYISVSKLIAKYKNEFNKEHWSSYKALERLIPDFKGFKAGLDINSPEFIEHAKSQIDEKRFKEMKELILMEWGTENQASITKGNIYHLQKENLSYTRGEELNPYSNIVYKTIPIKGEEVDMKEGLMEDLFKLKDGFYPELLIWNDECKLAGQADKVFIETVGNKRFIDIDDYKSSKKITKHGFKGQKMKGALSHISDANYWHYSLQISAYAFMLEEFGYHVRHLGFHHFNKPYPINYLKKEIELITTK